jgi:hypothetical protein
MEDLLSTITSSLSITNDVGEGSQYLNPLRVTPPSPPWSPHKTTKLLCDDPITKPGAQINSPPSIVDLVPVLLPETNTQLNHVTE